MFFADCFSCFSVLSGKDAYIKFSFFHNNNIVNLKIENNIPYLEYLDQKYKVFLDFSDIPALLKKLNIISVFL